jgi:hypothetical protein
MTYDDDFIQQDLQYRHRNLAKGKLYRVMSDTDKCRRFINHIEIIYDLTYGSIFNRLPEDPAEFLRRPDLYQYLEDEIILHHDIQRAWKLSIKKPFTTYEHQRN